MLLLGQFAEELGHTLQSHKSVVKAEPQREVGIGGPQIHVDQVMTAASTLVE